MEKSIEPWHDPVSFPKAKYSLGNTLYQELIQGSILDKVILLAGQDRVKLIAHKCVLRGVSQFFKVELGDIVELPETISVQAAMAYLQVKLGDIAIFCVLTLTLRMRRPCISSNWMVT